MSLTTYQQLVEQLKGEIQSARIKATLSANAHLLALYWRMGKAIAEQETVEGWGSKVVEQLAKELRSEFPDMKGISPRNLRYMRSFALAYRDFLQRPALNAENEILQAPLAKLGNEVIQAPLAQITWYHHILYWRK